MIADLNGQQAVRNDWKSYLYATSQIDKWKVVFL